MDNLQDLGLSTENDTGFPSKRLLKQLQQRIWRAKSSYLVFCFLVPLVLMFGIYLTRGLHPFGDGTPLVLDLNSQYAYFFEGLRNFVYGDADSLFYSFSRSLGGEFMGMYAYYLASPLSYIVALFPQDRIQEAILTIILLKTALSGFTFGFYLHKHTRKPNKFATVAFSAMYALSAYAVCHQSNTMWMDTIIWLPIFAYSLEQLMLNRKYKLYAVSLSLILVCNYYIGYMVCIFAVLYFLYYYFSKSSSEINPRGERLHFIRTGTRFALFSILAAAISAFMLIAAYYSLGFGKSGFSSTNWAPTANFDIIDMLTKFLPGAYDTFEPSGIPFLYCGLLTVIMFPVYFTSRAISSREKIASASLVGFLVFSLIFNPVDLVWHGMSVPNWLNGRYSFILCFFLLILAYKAFGNLRKAGEKFILCICALLLLFIAVAQKFELESFINSDKKLLTLGCVWFSVIFTVALLALICLKIRVKTPKTQSCISGILAAVICIEVFCNGVVCFEMINKDVLFTKYSSYQDFVDGLRPVVNDVKEYDDGFYRMEKLHHRQPNDNFALGIRGLSNSTSTLNASAIKFMNSLGFTARTHLTQYNGRTPLTDSLLGVKYVIDRESSVLLDGVYEPVDEIENESYKVYENPYALSLAYGSSKDIEEFDTEEYDIFFQRLNALLTAISGEEDTIEAFKPVKKLESDAGNCKEVAMMTSLKYNSPEDQSGTFTLKYVAPYTGSYYFYTPLLSSAPSSVSLKINNGAKFSYLARNTNHIVNVGYFEEGSEINIAFTISKDSYISINTRYGCLWYIDDEEYGEAMTSLLEGPQLAIDDASEDDNIFGTITTKNAEQMILTTIPYDEGWKVYVDGEQVEIYETLDALMAFDISDSGEHTVEMKYMPDVYTLGFTVSLVAILLFIAICLLEIIAKKTLFKKYPRELFPDFWTLEDIDPELLPEPTADEEQSEADGQEEPAEEGEATEPSDADGQSDREISE